MTATIDSTTDNSNSPAPVERSAKELRRENSILRTSTHGSSLTYPPSR